MTVYIVLFLAVAALIALLLYRDVPDPTPKCRNTSSTKTKAHSAQNSCCDDNYPNYAQQHMQRVLRENAERAHKEFMDTQRATMEAQQTAMDMQHNSMDCGCGSFDPFF
jgi:hypothetical protein